MEQKKTRKTKSRAVIPPQAPITLQEFHSWLRGIMDIQGPDWSPDKNQWQMIYAKIQAIRASAQPAAALAVPQQAPIYRTPQPASFDEGFTAAMPAAMPAAAQPPAIVPSTLASAAISSSVGNQHASALFQGKKVDSNDVFKESSFV